MVNDAVDEAGDKIPAATDRALSDLARLNLDKDAAAKVAARRRAHPFASLERMLDARMSSESPSCAGERRGAANVRGRRSSACDPARRDLANLHAPPHAQRGELSPPSAGTSSRATSTSPRVLPATSLAGRWFAARRLG